MRPGNPWDLKGCRQKQGESPCEYIRCFSKQCNALPDIANVDIIRALLSRTTCESLVHKLRRKNRRTTKEFLDLATSHTSGEEAVRAIFDRNKGKTKREEHAGDGVSNRFGKKKNKKGPEGMLITVVEHKGRQAPDTDAPNFFEKKIEGPCLNHAYPVKHAYRDCPLMKWFMLNGPKGGDRGGRS